MCVWHEEIAQSQIIITQYITRPRGKEGAEVRKSQNKGKENENSYQKLKRSPRDRHTKSFRVFLCVYPSDLFNFW